MKWYHGTSKQNAEKILKEGVLKPGQDTVYDIDIPRHDAVYIADYDVAYQYALERNGSVIEVAQPNPKKLIPDEDDVYDLLNDRGGELNTKGQNLAGRVQALWLRKWNEENAAWRTEGYGEEQFPSYPNFEAAWAAWSEIEFEGSAELAEQMKDLTDYILKNDPKLAQAIIAISGKAAHIGPLKVVGLAKKQTAAKKVELIKTPGFVIEVPQERRKKFFVRPKTPLEYWAFKNRPRVFLNEQIIFTFGGKPVAEAVVVKVEPPGHGEGEHKQWHKVYWKPSRFKKFRGVIAADSDSTAASGKHAAEDEDYYMVEGCGIYAVELARKNGGEIYVMSADRGEEWSDEIPYEVTHAFVKKDGKTFDIRGERTPDKMAWELSMGDYSIKGPWTPDAFEAKFMGSGDDKPLFGKDAALHEGSFFWFEPGFPEDVKKFILKSRSKEETEYCEKESRWWANKLAAAGFEPTLVKGDYKDPDNPDIALVAEHWWVEVGGKIFDPTAVQFGGESPERKRYVVWDQHKKDSPLVTDPVKGGWWTHKKGDKIIDVGDGDQYWAGEGNGASGILPVCPQKGTVCLAWRSQYVMTPHCWGTIGGAIQKGKSPQESAKSELAEETGYSGGMTLIPAYVFTDRAFSYHNFIGVTATEFPLAPKPFSKEHVQELKKQLHPEQYYQLNPGWETDHIEWVPYATVVDDMNENPEDYHPGMLKLFKNSKDAIERALGIEDKGEPSNETPKQADSVEPDQIDTDPEVEFQNMKNYLNSLEWYGRNPWYPEKYPWFSIRLRGNAGWYASNDLAKEKLAEGKDLASLKQYLSKFDLNKLRSKPAFKDTIDVTPTQNAIVKRGAHNPACKCDMCRSIPAWKRPWLTGKCHEFALALSSTMPDAQFVAIGNAMFEHVGLRVGDTYYDVRGAMTKDEFAELFGSNADSIHDVSTVQVMKDSFPSYIGHEDELVETSDFKSALNTVKRVFAKRAFTPQDTSRLPCPSGKRKFYDQTSAVGPHKQWDAGTPNLRAYKCPKCGWWHLSSKPQLQRPSEPQQPQWSPQGVKPLKAAEQTEMFPNSQDARFRQWFDGSKVVDKQGRPMPVYHGTRSSVEFDEFAVDGPPQVEDSYEGETTSSGSGSDPTAFIGAHFAEEANVANQFAQGQGWTRTRYEGESPKPRVIQVFLRITNPKDFGGEENLRNFIYQGSISEPALDIVCRMETGFEPWEEADEEGTQKVEEFYQNYKTDQGYRTRMNESLLENYRPMDMEDEELRDAAYELAMQARSRLEKAGHDGVRYKNIVEGGHAWIAFAANQIKSAWSNFTPNDPRFTASVKEAAPLHEEGKKQKFYHGTNEEALAKKIMQEGIQPRMVLDPSKAKSRAQLAPVPDRVYMTTSFGYAAIYALGGSMFGVGEKNLNFLKGKDPFGYVFETEGSALTGDITPDEDSIGEWMSFLIGYQDDKKKFEDWNARVKAGTPLNDYEKGQYERYKKEGIPYHDQAINKPGAEADDARTHFRWMFANFLTEKQRWAMHYNPDIGILAVVGKKLQKRMTPEVTKFMLDNGAHAAHQGAVHPTKAWKIDKVKAITLGGAQSNWATEVPMAASKAAAAHTPEYAQKLIETLKQTVHGADFKVIGSVGSGQSSENDLDILVTVHPDAVLDDDNPWVESSGLTGAMNLLGFDYLGPSDFTPEESVDKSETSGKYLDPQGSGIEKFFNSTTMHTVEFWFTDMPEPGMKEADWKSKYVLPTALALGLGAPSVAPSTLTPQQIEQQHQREQQAEAEKAGRERLDQLIEAISRAEGAKPELNNPGNLVDFNTGEIKTFDSLEEGRDALADQLNRIADGMHPKIKPDMTLREAGLVYSNGDPNWARNVSLIMRVPQSIKMVELIRGQDTEQAGNAAPSDKSGSWLKKAAGFAFKSFQKLWHIGTMNPKDKRNDSYEGAGLSVSVNPEEWSMIAKLPGDMWEFTKPSNKFVNFHRLSAAQRKKIANWGIKNGYAEPANLWRHSYYDEELDDTRYSDYATKEEAEAELGGYGGDEKVEPVKGGLTATPKLSQKSLRGKIDPLEVMDLLVTAYAEDELDCDGVWWADDLDPENLSAPRGVIFPSKLPSWKKRKMRQAGKTASGEPKILHRGPQGFDVELREGEARVGFLQIDINGATAIVKAIDVNEDYQRRGIATKLYAAARVELKKRGVKTLKGALEGSGPVQIREKVFGPGKTKYYHGGEEINAAQAIQVMDVDYGYTRAETHLASDIYLYHGTTNTAFQKMMLDGGVVEAGSYWGTERVAATYAEEAVDAALDYEAEEEEVIIRIPISRFNQVSLKPDENSVAEPLTYTLKRKDDDLYADWQESKGTWQDCLRIYESVRYDAPLHIEQSDRLV